MKLRPCILLLLMAAIAAYSHINAQSVSYQTGFYPVDSLFFTVNQAPPQGGKIEISVNCFTNSNCFHTYQSGVWLYNRSNEPNTWEDQQVSRPPTEAYNILAHRGHLDKVNVVQVRIKNARGAILSDSAYFIGVLGKGAPYPYTVPVVQLLVDSMDAFGPLGFYGPGKGIDNFQGKIWNYSLDQTPKYSSYIPRSRVEKNCTMQILDGKGHTMLSQQGGIQLTGTEYSRSLTNKGLDFVARKEYSGSNTFTSALFGKSLVSHELNFTVGSGVGAGFGALEIGEGIIAGLKVGDVPTRQVITFLNGSYWSLCFAQPDIKDYISDDNNQKDPVNIFKPLYFVRSSGLVQKIQSMKIDTQKIAWVTLNKGAVGAGFLEQGTKDQFLALCKPLLNSVGSNAAPLPFSTIDSLTDLNSWLTYIATVDFGHVTNSIGHHAYIGTAYGKKMFVLMDNIDGFGTGDAGTNFWNEGILASDTQEKTFAAVLIQDIILKNKVCTEKLCLRYEDLLNTNFKAENTTAIVQKVTAEILPEYKKYWQSWTPNAGADSAGEVASLQNISNFCSKRPDIAWQQMADQWLPEAKLHIADRKNVTVILDSVPQGTVKVHLNSLTITKNWNGLYYPEPSLEVSMDLLNVPAGYKVVWKEYPDMPISAKVPAKSNITLTPVLRPR